MDWLDLLVVRGTLKNLLQHYSSKASILRSFSTPRRQHPRRLGARSFARGLSRLLAASLRKTLYLSAPDANKDLFFKQTGSAYGGRAGGGSGAGHEAGWRPDRGRRR